MTLSSLAPAALLFASLVVQGSAGDSMDKLHGSSDVAQLTQYSWNVFRYVGDYLHLFGVVVLLVNIGARSSVAGVSKSTQILYCLVFCTRYLDLLEHEQATYLVVFKLTYIATSLLILVLFKMFENTYEARHDTFNIAVVIIPCLTASFLLTSEYAVIEILWTFSEFIEGFAMVPQYIFCYRTIVRDAGQNVYVICLGAYRVFYAINWIYKKINMPGYSDYQSWIGGIIEIIFFVDFLNYRFTGHSMLRAAVLSVDSKINEAVEQVEVGVFGSSRAERKDADGGAMRRRRKADDDSGAFV